MQKKRQMMPPSVDTPIMMSTLGSRKNQKLVLSQSSGCSSVVSPASAAAKSSMPTRNTKSKVRVQRVS